MFDHLPTLNTLLRQLQRVPYLASKNVYRVAQYILDMDDEQYANFVKALEHARSRLVRCRDCRAWHESGSACRFCTDPSRDHTAICVVATWQDLCAIERSGAFQGEYHVLGGVLSPLDGVGPADLSFDALVARLGDRHKELIIAFNQTTEGEATASYIARLCADKHVAITSLARGMPVGSSLEYTDRLTLLKSISERRSLSYES